MWFYTRKMIQITQNMAKLSSDWNPCFFLYHTSRRSMFFSRSTPMPCCWGAHLAWGRKINWSQIVWSRKWYKIKNCSFCIISLSRMHYFKNWSQILKGNAALQPANHLWAQFFPWQVHNSQKCIFVIFWHSHLVVVSGDHVQDLSFLFFPKKASPLSGIEFWHDILPGHYRKWVTHVQGKL